MRKFLTSTLITLFLTIGTLYSATPHIVPNADNDANLGSPQRRWSNLNVSTANVNAIKFGDGTTQITAASGVGSSTSFGISNVVISTIGSDTNMIQSSFSFIDVMGVAYYNAAATASLAVSGIGGLDTGSEASSNWYYLYAISNGVNFNLIFSLNATQPLLPSGFTKWRRVTAIRNDGSSNIVPFIKHDSEVAYFFPSSSPGYVLNTNPPSATWTDIDMTPFLPPTAYDASIEIWVDNTAANLIQVFIHSKGYVYNSSFGEFDFTNVPIGGANSTVLIPIYNSPQLWEYRVNNAGNFGQLYSIVRLYHER